MAYLALWLIRLYQRLISPKKGFCCAHRIRFSGDSCSEAIYKGIQRRGFWSGLKSARIQFDRCRHAHLHLQEEPKKPKKDDKKKADPCRDSLFESCAEVGGECCLSRFCRPWRSCDGDCGLDCGF